MIKDGTHISIGVEQVVDCMAQTQYNPDQRDVYQFGVCTGGLLGSELHHMSLNNLQYNHVWGFDSMEGLPVEQAGITKHESWEKGAFNVQKIYNLKSIDEAMSLLKTAFKMYPVTFIPGYFSDSLLPTLASDRGFKPAIYVSVDVDLYISTIQCMEFMYQNNLIIPGTIIRYDDWSGTDFTGGEKRAHVELAQKYNKQFRTIHEDLMIVLQCVA